MHGSGNAKAGQLARVLFEKGVKCVDISVVQEQVINEIAELSGSPLLMKFILEILIVRVKITLRRFWLTPKFRVTHAPGYAT